MAIQEFIKPELIIVSVVCYFIGMAIKNTTILKDKYIPFVNGAVGVMLATIYVLATTPLATVQDTLMAVFVGITQGVLCAGASTYINQLIKQGGAKG